MATQRERVVSRIKSWVGKNEADGSHREIIDIYNSHTPWARGYKMPYTQPWCATTVSAVAIKEKLTHIMPTECSCGEMIKLYQKKGRWVENDAFVPKPGDIVMYYWKDNGVGDCVGWPDHVGIVVSVSGNTMKIAEGNLSNAVGYRTLQVNGKYIRGYCCPAYEEADVKDEIDITIENAVKDVKLTSPDLWEDVLRGRTKPTASQVKALMDKYHAAVEAKR